MYLGASMEEIFEIGLRELEKRNVDYGDIRLAKLNNESIDVKNGSVESIRHGESIGYGIRVVKGGWGFASSSDMTQKGVCDAIDLAVKIARASSIASDPVVLKDIDIHEDVYNGHCKKDPFEVPLEDKIDILTESEKRMRIDDRIKVSNAVFRAWKIYQLFGSTEGAKIVQNITQCGGGISATASDGKDVQTRSYPNSFGGDFHSQGYEFFLSLDLMEHAEKTARESVELLSAKQCPSGKMDLILETSQLALQVHESCGHPTELDRVRGTEASYAGTSFLTIDKLNGFRYGSDIVNITSDATTPYGLGTFGYDDEGVKAKKVYLVKNGLFSGYQASREDAADTGLEVSGNMRGDGWQNLPLVRMTNINLEPGTWSREEIIEETERGIIMDTIKSWSIDDKRLNFLFGTEAGYLVEGGEITALIRNPTYTGITYDFWGNCDAIAGDKDWKLHGVPNCGKGEPPQTMKVGHGCAPSRFKDISVGVGKW